MKQTAVEWLIQNIVEDQTIKSKSMSEWIKVFDNAKAMEREQIEDAFGKERIVVNGEGYFKVFNSKQYYNETYKETI